MMKNNAKLITHSELCSIGAKYLKNQGIIPFYKCSYVVCDYLRVGECPDAFGFGNTKDSQMLEVKVSRSDFIADKNKHWRINPEFGLGSYRSYLCPEGVILPEDLPKNWGLLYWNGKSIDIIVYPEKQECSSGEELKLVSSILRREGISSRIFNYVEIESI